MNIEFNNIPYITSNDKIILFDGVCKLCNAWCNFIIKYDKHHVFKLTAMQSDTGLAVLKYLKQPTDHFETMLYIENNIVYEKSTAFIKVVEHLPYPVKLLFLLKLIPNFIRDFIYDRIALNRYKLFGKYKECRLPKKDHGSHNL